VAAANRHQGGRAALVVHLDKEDKEVAPITTHLAHLLEVRQTQDLHRGVDQDHLLHHRHHEEVVVAHLEQ